VGLIILAISLYAVLNDLPGNQPLKYLPYAAALASVAALLKWPNGRGHWIRKMN
jgi:hypothetical protein